MKGVWKVSGRYEKCVWRLLGGWLEGTYGMSEWYMGFLDISKWQVRTGQVRIDHVKSGQVKSGQVESEQVKSVLVRSG